MRRGSMGVKMLSARQYEVINLFLNLNTRVELFRWVRETRQQEVCRLREEIEQGLLLLARERVDSNEKLVAWARALGAVGSA